MRNIPSGYNDLRSQLSGFRSGNYSPTKSMNSKIGGGFQASPT